MSKLHSTFRFNNYEIENGLPHAFCFSTAAKVQLGELLYPYRIFKVTWETLNCN